jgi:hypothetical protein
VGYFSNGTEGAIFEEQFCRRCIHYGPVEGPGCPVWLAHLLFAYEECNSDSNAKTILDLLIECKEITADDGLPLPVNECQMFVEDKANQQVAAA